MPIYEKGELNPNHSYNSFPIVINNNTRGTVSEYDIDGNMVQAETKEYSITGTSPLDFQSNGSNATISISGNMLQSGTPTPASPITPQECGERTDNLWDEDYTGIASNPTYRHLFVGDGTFTLSTTFELSYGITDIFLLSGNVSSGISSSTNGAYKGKDITAQSIDGYVTIAYRKNANTGASSIDHCKTILNAGSTALPYEPYGYKIPITIGSNTNYIYTKEPIRKIGNYADVVNSDGSITRNIKKLVLTGEENWQEWGQSSNDRYFRITQFLQAISGKVVCTHYVSPDENISISNTVQGCKVQDSSSYGRLLIIRPPEYQIWDADDFKTYLTQQYQNGTPVTVWYVLATPDTTETTTMPTLTTINGKNTATIGTTIAPSSITINATSKVYPYNPIIPEMCGERTAQIIDYALSESGGIDASGNLVASLNLWRSNVFYEIQSEMTLSFVKYSTLSKLRVNYYDINYSHITREEIDAENVTSAVLTIPTNAKFFKWTLYAQTTINIDFVKQCYIMLNTGSTPLPYEPYGYKITNTIQSGNLFDYTRTVGVISNKYISRSTGDEVSDNDYDISYPIPVYTNTEYTWRFNNDSGSTHNSPTVAFFDSSDNQIGVASHGSPIRYFSFTTPSNCAYIRASVYKRNSNNTEAMLNVGSTPLPYEQYKTPVYNNIYLGEVETTRKIKKLVLTGQEKWAENSSGTNTFRGAMALPQANVNFEDGYCTHLPYVPQGISKDIEAACCNSGSIYIRLDRSIANDITEFKQYLQQQYANGTPITVWYVLATETTGVVNEPLCKIGTYSDKLLSTSTGVPQITLNTDISNTISFDTKIQPSQFNIRYFEEGYTEETDIKMKIPTFKDHTYTQYPISISNATNKNCSATIYGNGIQNGTPSPSNIVPFDGCGEKTDQIIPYPYYSTDGQYAGVQFTTTTNGHINANGTTNGGLLYYLYRPTVFSAGRYTLKVFGKHKGASIYFRDVTNAQTIGYIWGGQGDKSTSFDVPEGISIMVYINTSGVSELEFDCDIMLVPGNTEPTVYEPYGYKIPSVINGKNLWNPDSRTNNQAGQLNWGVVLPAGTYTITNNSNTSIYWRDGVSSTQATTFASAGTTATKTANNAMVAWCSTRQTNVMLNMGSDPIPYEPYTEIYNNVYLGEVNTTRRIKKLVLTGEEFVYVYANADIAFRINTSDMMLSLRTQGYCTHFSAQYTPGLATTDGITFGASDKNLYFTFSTETAAALNIVASDTASFKAYLASQYTNGTPVTVWYVLGTETTGIVNEPLYQIGEYSDKVQTNIELKTLEQNTISIDTQVQPSKVVLNYKSADQNDTYNSIKHVLDNQGAFIYKSPVYYNWNTVREIVRAGLAPQYYPIGSVFYDNGDPSTGTAFEVVAYDHHFDPALTSQGYTHSITLCEKLLTDVYVFDNIEAMLYVETAIPAGTYKFTIPNYDASYGGNKTYYFTSTADVPVDSQIVLKWDNQKLPESVTAYVGPNPQTSTTPLTGFNALALTEWVDGTSLEATDLGTVSGPNAQAGTSNYGQMNHIQRARYGSNNYLQSGVRQYINASTAANTWWQPQTVFDRPYTQRTQNGKLMGLNQDMVSVLAKPEIQSKTNQYFETTSLDGTTFTLDTNYTITTDTMFLLSPMEVGFNTVDTTVGTLLDYYTAGTSGDANNKRIKIKKSNDSTYYWWLRTPYPIVCYTARVVNTSGDLGSSRISTIGGVAAACIIQ